MIDVLPDVDLGQRADGDRVGDADPHESRGLAGQENVVALRHDVPDPVGNGHSAEELGIGRIRDVIGGISGLVSEVEDVPGMDETPLDPTDRRQ